MIDYRYKERTNNMVRIRLRRVGSRHQPSYRIVVADKESPRDGRFLEILGNYNPRTEPATIDIDEIRLFHWLKRGAQPSASLTKVLKTVGTWERWERYKAGEDVSTLIEEAQERIPEVDPRTRRDDLFGVRRQKKEEEKPAPSKEATPASEIEEEPKAAPEEPTEKEASEAEVDQEEAPQEEAQVEASPEDQNAEKEDESENEEAPAKDK